MSISLTISSFFAGLLTIFSPCILPMVPFVVKSSLQKNKFGPIFLALGLALSFSLSTYIIATSGQLLGLAPDKLKIVSGFILLIASLLFIFPVLTDKLSLLMSPISNRLQSYNSTNITNNKPLLNEFISGFFLGPIWAPCSGPTLAVIIGLIISNPESKTSIPLLAVFSIGSILPILFFSYGAQGIIKKVQRSNLDHSTKVKKILGILCACMAVLIIFGIDKKLEAYLLTILPETLTNLSLTI